MFVIKSILSFSVVNTEVEKRFSYGRIGQPLSKGDKNCHLYSPLSQRHGTAIARWAGSYIAN
jgi:hypothetical protein